MQKCKQFWFVLFLTGCMLLMTMLVLLKGMDRPPIEFLHIQDRLTGANIEPFYEESEDTYYLYMPSYASEETMKLSLRVPGFVRITDEKGDGPGQEIFRVPGGQTISMYVRSPLRGQTVKVKVLYTTGVSSLYVDGEAGLLDRIHEDKRIEKSVSAILASSDGDVLFKRHSVMSGRGNGSWNEQMKRPYNLSFSSGVTAGPFRDIDKLCLIAEYGDESKVRNTLAYFAGRELGIPYTSDYMYTNLYVNGEYRGLYGITTKQEYTKHVKEDGIKAVFELTSSDDVDFNTIRLGIKPFRIMYGNPDYVWDIADAFDNAVNERDWDKCFSLMDMDSFALKYALDEFLGNMDLGHASQYYYVDEHGVIHCMLPWDYDWTIGSTWLFFNNRADQEIKTYHYWDYWATVMLENESFREKVVEILETHFTEVFFDKLESYMRTVGEQIAQSKTADVERWEHETQYLVLYPHGTYQIASGAKTVDEFCQLFREYFSARKKFLVEYFNRIEDYCVISFSGSRLSNICIPKGDALAPYLEGANIMDGYQPGSVFLGWFTEDGRQVQEIEYVTEDLYFTSKLVPIEKEADG